jgi:hypothetical protein
VGADVSTGAFLDNPGIDPLSMQISLAHLVLARPATATTRQTCRPCQELLHIVLTEKVFTDLRRRGSHLLLKFW